MRVSRCEKEIKCSRQASHLIYFPQLVSKFNNTIVRMLDSIYHMKSHLCRKTRLCHYVRNVVMDGLAG